MTLHATMRFLLIYVLVFWFSTRPLRADVFLAIADIEALLSVEIDVSGVIEEYIAKEMQRLQQLKLYEGFIQPHYLYFAMCVIDNKIHTSEGVIFCSEQANEHF